MRQRIFEIIEVGTEQDKASRAYDVFMMLTIIISIIPLWTHDTTKMFNIIDKVTVVVFILDYLFRLATAEPVSQSKLPRRRSNMNDREIPM